MQPRPDFLGGVGPTLALPAGDDHTGSGDPDDACEP
jgi:hypothetical protein